MYVLYVRALETSKLYSTKLLIFLHDLKFVSFLIIILFFVAPPRWFLPFFSKKTCYWVKQILAWKNFKIETVPKKTHKQKSQENENEQLEKSCIKFRDGEKFQNFLRKWNSILKEFRAQFSYCILYIFE